MPIHQQLKQRTECPRASRAVIEHSQLAPLLHRRSLCNQVRFGIDGIWITPNDLHNSQLPLSKELLKRLGAPSQSVKTCVIAIKSFVFDFDTGASLRAQSQSLLVIIPCGNNIVHELRTLIASYTLSLALGSPFDL